VSILPDEPGTTTEGVLDAVVRRLEEAWCPAPPPEVSNFGYWPTPIPIMLAGIDALRDHGYLALADVATMDNERRVVELGCGIGRNLLLLHRFGFANLLGVEWFPQYAAVASWMCPAAEVVVGDIYDQAERLAEADIVFTYRPYRGEKQEAFEAWLVEHVRPGTLLWTPQRAPAGVAHLGGFVGRVEPPR
jgi:hypothetical protein